MDLVLIENLLRLLEKSTVNELDVTEDGVRIRMTKLARPASVQPSASGPRAETPEETAEAQIAELLALPHEHPSREHTVVAGLIGTFYRASSPDVPPFAIEGENIEDGQTLGLIEAMKTFNPVEADCKGRLKTILVADATPVSAGMPLFIIEKDA